jgi:hypothetical protein
MKAKKLARGYPESQPNPPKLPIRAKLDSTDFYFLTNEKPDVIAQINGFKPTPWHAFKNALNLKDEHACSH